MLRLFSVIVPIYQNELNIEDMVEALLSVKKQLPNYSLEILFVEDGSSDRSREVLHQMKEKYPDVVSLVLLTRNFGQFPAIQAGLTQAKGDCVGIVSCDLQEPVEKFADMVAEWEKGSKFIIGDRENRKENVVHRLFSNIYWMIIRRFALRNFPTYGFDFCLLDKEVVAQINKIHEKNTSIFPLLWWLGYKAKRIPITRQNRKKGTSQWRWWMKVKLMIDTLIGFTHLPARIISGLGILCGIFFVVFSTTHLIHWYRFQTAPEGWMTVVMMLGIFGSLILVSIGFVLEYLVRILDETRSRPLFIIEDVISRD